MTMSRLGFDNLYGRVPATFGGRARGNGYIVPVIAKTEYAFAGVSGTPQEIPVATGIDTSAYVSGVLAVRVHAKTAWPTGSTLDVWVQNVMLTPEEPDVLFLSSTNLIAATPIAIPAAAVTTPPLYYVSPIVGMGPMVRVLLRFNQGSTAVPPQTIQLGIDLVGRPA